MTDLIDKHGGYRKLKSFQIAQLVYDITVRFVDKYVSRFSRTTDQMVQAARSGVQNIAEGSQASATSRETEIKLTQVARASLEELKLDYEDFLRHKRLKAWDRNHPLRQEMVNRRFQSVDEVAGWIVEVSRRSRPSGQSSPQTVSTKSILSTEVYPELSANAALTLISVSCYLLDQQVKKLANEFKMNGGFKERMYKVRSEERDQQSVEPNTPVCPNCSKPMRKRFPRNQSASSSPFWGCSDFPNCKGTKPFHE